MLKSLILNLARNRPIWLLILYLVSYNDDKSVGYVSGSLVKLVMAMASNESKQHEVSCCSGQYAAMTTKTCGNGVSCENICGGQSSGSKL